MKQISFMLLFLMTLKAFGQVEVPFTSEEWSYFEREPIEFKTVSGRDVLYLNGHGMLKNAFIQDGSIELDFKAQKERAFAGIQFRAQGQGNNETVYVRLHKSGAPDAIQYNPEYNGESNWQLYREHQATVSFDATSWNHLKVEFRGSTLLVYLNDMSNPILQVNNLRRDDESGFIGFYSFMGAYFANFKYTAFEQAMPFQVKKSHLPNTIKGWDLSETYRMNDVDINSYPSDMIINWIYVTSEPNGLLPINKYRAKTSSGNFEENPTNVVWARHMFTAQEECIKKFSFDFSDDAVVYFNGIKVFEGKNGFRAKGPLFRGDLLIDGNILYLNAQKGSNEIMIAVSDKANGWGLMGKLQ